MPAAYAGQVQLREASMIFLWLKAIHVFFVISWFAGLFYLPRIFVNLAGISVNAAADSGAERARLLGMAGGLKRFLIPLMLGTWIFGIAMIVSGGADGMHMWLHQHWLHAKLALVLVLTGYDGYCKKLLRDFQ